MNAKKIILNMGILCCLLAFCLPCMAQATKKLYVGNLPYQVTSEEMKQLFGQAGTVEEVQLPIDRETGRQKGFAYVTMSSSEEADYAVNNLNGMNYINRDLKVDYAREYEQAERNKAMSKDNKMQSGRHVSDRDRSRW